MANNFNLKGTTFSSFRIGKGGPTIWQSNDTPDGTDGIAGDLWIVADGPNSGLYQKIDSTWQFFSAGGDIAGLTPALNEFIVGDGTNFITLGGSDARDALGLGEADVPVFSGILAGGTDNIDLFSDADAVSITVGGPTSTVVVDGNLTVNGTTTVIHSQTLDVADKNITVNVGGNTAGTVGSGINIEGDSAVVVGYLRVNGTNNANLEFKAPTGSTLNLDVNSDKTLTIAGDFNVAADSAIDQDLRTTASASLTQLSLTGTGSNSFTGSVVVGSPTGGSQGTGTINATGLYINGTPVSAGSGVESLGQLTDVTITTATLGDVLHYNGTVWVNNQTGATSGVQAHSANLDTIAGLTPADDAFIVGDGTNWTALTGTNARNAIGLGAADNVTFTSITQENATFGAKSSQYIVYNTTTDNTPTELYLDGTSEQLVLADNSSWFFEVAIIARRTDASDDIGSFKISGMIDRQTGEASTLIVGDPIIEGNLSTNAATWIAGVAADTTNGSLQIIATGENSKTIKWTASVKTIEAKNI